MVGDDAVDGAVEHAGGYGQTVFLGAQRRVHLQVRVVRIVDGVFVQEEVMRRGLGRDGQTLGLRLTHQINATRRGDVLDVQRRASKAAQGDIACDLQFLAFRRPAKHTQARAAHALVHHAVAHQVFVLTVRHDDLAELIGVIHDAAHHAGALHAMAIVGEGNGAVAHHIAHFGERLARQALRAGAHHVNAALPHLFGHTLHVFNRDGVVDGGLGVGHACHGSEAAMRSGARAAGDVFLLLLAWVTQMHVDVYQTGRDNLARAIDFFGVGSRKTLAHLGNLAVLNKDVADFVEFDLRVDYACVLKQKGHYRSLPTAGTVQPCACRYLRTPDQE